MSTVAEQTGSFDAHVALATLLIGTASITNTIVTNEPTDAVSVGVAALASQGLGVADQGFATVLVGLATHEALVVLADLSLATAAVAVIRRNQL